MLAVSEKSSPIFTVSFLAWRRCHIFWGKSHPTENPCPIFIPPANTHFPPQQDVKEIYFLARTCESKVIHLVARTYNFGPVWPTAVYHFGACVCWGRERGQLGSENLGLGRMVSDHERGLKSHAKRRKWEPLDFSFLGNNHPLSSIYSHYIPILSAMTRHFICTPFPRSFFQLGKCQGEKETASWQYHGQI